MTFIHCCANIWVFTTTRKIIKNQNQVWSFLHISIKKQRMKHFCSWSNMNSFSNTCSSCVLIVKLWCVETMFPTLFSNSAWFLIALVLKMYELRTNLLYLCYPYTKYDEDLMPHTREIAKKGNYICFETRTKHHSKHFVKTFQVSCALTDHWKQWNSEGISCSAFFTQVYTCCSICKENTSHKDYHFLKILPENNI